MTDISQDFSDLRAMYINCTLKKSPTRATPRVWST